MQIQFDDQSSIYGSNKAIGMFLLKTPQCWTHGTSPIHDYQVYMYKEQDALFPIKSIQAELSCSVRKATYFGSFKGVGG